MSRNVFLIILCVTLLFSFVGCAQKDSPPSIENDESAESNYAPTNAPTNEIATEDTDDDQVAVDENLLTVELTFPAGYFGGTDMSTFDTDAYIKEYDFLSATVHEDGSLTVLMTKARQKELLDELAATIEEMIIDYTNGEETSYIKEIVHNEDFTSFTMRVDRAGFENSFDCTEPSLIISCALYHMYAGIAPEIQFETVDADTNEIISSNTY